MKIAKIGILIAAIAALATSAFAHRGIRNRVTIQRPIAEVYAALSTNEGFESWTTLPVKFDLRPGGSMLVNPGGGPDLPGGTTAILAYEPGRMISFGWDPPSTSKVEPAAEGRCVVFRLEDMGPNSTRLTHTVLGFGEGSDWDDIYAYMEKTVPESLTTLKFSTQESKGAWMRPAAADAAKDAHTVEIEVPVSAERAWQFMTTRDEMLKWMAPAVELDWRVGGTLKANYDAKAGIGGKGTITHHILALEPGVMFAMRYEAPDAPPDAVLGEKLFHVTTIEPIDATHARIRLTGVGYGTGPEWDKVRKFFEAGNAYEMNHIKELLSEGAAVGGEAKAKGEG